MSWGEKAVALAQRFDQPDTLARALNFVGSAFITAGDIERGVDFLGQSLDVAKAHALEQRIAHAYTNLGTGLGEMYELERAEGTLRENIDFSDEQDLDSGYPRAWLAAVLVYRGRWTEGASVAADLLARERSAVARDHREHRARPGSRPPRRPGRDDALDEALALAQPGGHLQRLGHLHAARAEAAWLSGDREATIAEAQAVYPLALEKRHLWFTGELAYWQWKAGAPDQAPEWIAEPYRLQIDGQPGPPPSAGAHAIARTRRRAR